MKYCILLLLLSLPAFSKWTELKTIKGSENYKNLDSMYTDSATNIHHIIFMTSGSSTFIYMQLDSDLNILNQTSMWNNDCYYVNRVFIRGADNAKDLIVVMEGDKMRGSQRISDLWYKESSDYGKTWTQWYKIEHSEDKERRTGDTVLWVKETGRVFIFYELRTLTRTYPCMVTKPPGSQIFAKEKMLSYDYKILDILGADYTIDAKKQVVLHLFIGLDNETSRLQEIMYMNSTDQGSKWSTAVSISGKDNCNAQDWSTAVLAGRGKLATIFTTYALETPSKMKLVHSESHGKKFKSTNATNGAVKMFHPSHRAPTLALCGPNSKKLFLFSFIQISESDFEAAVWDAHKLTYTKLDHPVHDFDYYSGHHITCNMNPKNSSEVVMTLAIGIGGDDQGTRVAEYTQAISDSE